MMKNLTAWIVGIVALGLGLGAVVSTTGADLAEPTALEVALQTTPLVDCGSGREPMLEPVLADGRSTFRVRCIATGRNETGTHVAPGPTVVVAPAPVPTPSPTESPETAADTRATRSPEQESRSWKQSAVVIGGAAGTGAGIGALTKGKKGAVMGAAIGAASGAAYELIKKDGKVRK